jgi:hypothetical protein
MSEKFKIKQIILEQIYFNSEVARFLGSLKSRHDKDIAGKTLDFIKKYLSGQYPQAVDALNGKLILEETTED